MRRSVWLAAVLTLTLAAVALADSVTKTDGTVVEGEITHEDDVSVTIKCKLGELKVPKDEIAKVERTPKYDPDPELEEIKKDSLKVLEEIRKKCDDAKLAGKAKAVSAIEDQIRAWSLKVANEGRAVPQPVASPAKLPGVDYEEFIDGYNKLGEGQTEAQAERARAEYLKKFDGKTTRFTGSLLEAKDDPVTSWDMKTSKQITTPRLYLTLRPESGTATRYFWAFSKSDIEKLSKAPIGSTVVVEGKLHTSGPQAQTLIWDPKYTVVPAK